MQNFLKNKKLSGIVIGLLLFIFALFMYLPIGWMIATSLREPLKAFTLPPSFFPLTFDLGNFKDAFARVNLTMFIKNSLIVSVLATALQLCASSMAAFAFARLNFKGKNILFFMFLAAMMVPHQVISIPRFIVMSKAGMINTHAALILPAIFNVLSIFMLRQSMLAIPKSYDEAAYIDGATRFQCYFKIILPMTKPTMMVMAMQTFINTWNDFYSALIYINDIDKMTLPLGLVQLNGYMDTGNKATVIAGVVISLIPSFVMYCFGQKYLIEGISIGGIK